MKADVRFTAVIERGKKTNRVRVDRRRGRVMDRKPRGSSAMEKSPQRAKLRNRSGERDVWCTISIVVRAGDLETIDDRAEKLGMSRSRYLAESGLLLAGHVPEPMASATGRKP